MRTRHQKPRTAWQLPHPQCLPTPMTEYFFKPYRPDPLLPPHPCSCSLLWLDHRHLEGSRCCPALSLQFYSSLQWVFHIPCLNGTTQFLRPEHQQFLDYNYFFTPVNNKPPVPWIPALISAPGWPSNSWFSCLRLEVLTLQLCTTTFGQISV